jgi:hypothetical protein
MQPNIHGQEIRKTFAWLLLYTVTLVPNIGISQSIESAAAPPVDTGRFIIRDESFLLPQAHRKGNYSSALFLYNVFTPKDWTLDMIKAPMLGYSAKYALTDNVELQGGIATIFVSTRINAGPFWNHSFRSFHLGIGYQAAFNYGILKSFGYNTVLTGWEQQPSISMGYSFQEMAITMRTDLYWTNVLYLQEGDNTIPFNNSFVNGYSFTFSLEQRLWSNRVMSFGFKWNYLRYHILAWPAFPVNSYHYPVPEFQLGLNF